MPRIVAVYVIVGIVWILGSDTLLLLGGVELGEDQVWLSVAKGLAFVAITAAALWLVLHRSLKRERALDDSRQLVLDHSSEGVWLLDAAGSTIWVNTAMAHLLGAEPAQLRGRPASEFVQQGERDRLELQLRAASAAGSLQVLRLQSLDGCDVDVRCKAVPLRDAEGSERGICLFVSDQRESTAARAALSVRQQALEQLPIGFTLADASDPELPLVYANIAFCELAGLPEAQIIGRNCRFLQGHDRDQPGVRVLRAAITAGEPCAVMLRNYRADGTPFQNELTLLPVRDDAGRLTHFAGIQRDVSERVALQQQVERLAYEDELTGLLTRFAFVQRGEPLARQHGGGSVLLLDPLRLGDINATRGHAAGDEVLKALAQRLQGLLRPGELAARVGGDEFAALLLPDADPAAPRARADHILAALAQPLVLPGFDLIPRLSAGLAHLDAGTRIDDAVDQASSAANLARDQLMDRVVIYDDVMRAAQLHRLSTTKELEQALAEREFDLYYEPKLRLADGRTVGAEALLRWRHPRHGLLRPGNFVAIAENSGLIVPIGRWVIESACRQLRRWLDAGLPLETLSVNVSRLQFDHADFLDYVAAAVEGARLPRGLLCIEITESLLMDESGLLRQRLEALRRLGIRLAIDDFGTG